VKNTLEDTPPELAADIADGGVALAGGGSLLRGFDERLWNETQTPVSLVDSPLTCVAVGAGRSLEEFPTFAKGAGERTSRKSARRRRDRRAAFNRLG
jgi:rod shape-determining protein MreB